MRLQLDSAEATDVLGQRMAQWRPPAAVIYLQGDLGAGKSTLARALLRSLGVQGAIRSPTYTLVERYPLFDGETPAGEAWHLDLYRIADAAELDFLGLDEAQVTVWLVEWPEKAGTGLPPPDLHVALETRGSGRGAVLEARTPVGEEWLRFLAADAQLQSLSVQKT